MRPSVLFAAAAVLLAACSGGLHNPAFESVQIVPAPAQCDPTVMCFEVHAPVDGTRNGVGKCEVYGPGDPDFLEPLDSNTDVSMRPGETSLWHASIPADTYNLSELNPICWPMVEG